MQLRRAAERIALADAEASAGPGDDEAIDPVCGMTVYVSTAKHRAEFEDDALRSLAEMAIKRKTGARGLRAIIEHLMLDVMYEIPMRADVTHCTITREMVEHGLHPLEGLKAVEPDERKKTA